MYVHDFTGVTETLKGFYRLFILSLPLIDNKPETQICKCGVSKDDIAISSVVGLTIVNITYNTVFNLKALKKKKKAQ